MRSFNEFEENNLKFLTQKNIEYTLVQITETGYNKSILDATDPMRQYFKTVGMHDYSLQPQGQDYKVVLPTNILDAASMYPTSTSLYRPETKKGDPRIWTNNLKKYCIPNDILLMLYHKEKIYVVNITHVNIGKAYNSVIDTPLKALIRDINTEAMSVANELISLLRDVAKEWHPAEVLADTGVGRAIETLLGIEMNSSRQPDYKGIELKSYREKRGVRAALFTQVPDWTNSRMKSAKEIVAKYGYMRSNKDGQMVKTYQNTISCTAPNAQSLGMTLYPVDEILAIEEKKAKMDKDAVEKFLKTADVALWQLPVLHQRLLEKHHETFWIEVESRTDGGKGYSALFSSNIQRIQSYLNSTIFLRQVT